MVGLWVAINGDTVELDVGDVVGRNVLVMVVNSIDDVYTIVGSNTVND